MSYFKRPLHPFLLLLQNGPVFAGLNFALSCGEQSLDKSNQWLGPKGGFFAIGGNIMLFIALTASSEHTLLLIHRYNRLNLNSHTCMKSNSSLNWQNTSCYVWYAHMCMREHSSSNLVYLFWKISCITIKEKSICLSISGYCKLWICMFFSINLCLAAKISKDQRWWS